MKWPFADPQSQPCLAAPEVAAGAEPILWVYHDAQDGGWQFQGEESDEEPVAASLLSVFQLHPDLADLADLPLGWFASRDSAEEPWERGPQFDFELVEAAQPHADRDSLKKGDRAQLVFAIQTGSEMHREEMWVSVKKRQGQAYLGVLENQPACTDELRQGDQLEFGPEHVTLVQRKPGKG